MRYLFAFLVFVALIFASSCRKDFNTVPSFGSLEFSKDTVFLDTIFTNIGSATYNLKVYNRGNKSITIPEIKLENGISSNYRLNVDGIPGKEFKDIDVLAKDSIFIFIETTINVLDIPDPLYTDRILFDNGDNEQDVDLVTLVQDANFIFPKRNAVTMQIDSLNINNQKIARGRFLEDSELIFSGTKPTVIYGFIGVPSNKTLTVEAGAKVYFHDNSGLIIDNNATLKVNGTLTEKVTFQGDRLENSFQNVPGQWSTIWLRTRSKNNEIHHAIIKNGILGLLVDGSEETKLPSIKIDNTEIYNHSAYGILGRTANIEAYNVVIGAAGQSSLAATSGGTYDFTHSTFANYWNSSVRQLPAVLVNNYIAFNDANGQEVVITDNLKAANFTNCIFEGNNSFELLFDKSEGSLFNYSVSNSLIKYDPSTDDLKEIPEMDFTKTSFYNDVIINGNANFRDTQDEDFIIGQTSDAIDKGTSTPFSLDLLGVDRTATPDIGAYQHIIFEE